MSNDAEKNRLKFELQMVQNEINRRHLRTDYDADRLHNFDKISALKSRKSRIQQQLCALRV